MKKSLSLPATERTVKLGHSLIICLAIMTALDAMAIDMYIPAFPMVAESFQVSASVVQQTLSVFLIGLAIGQGIYGPLLDYYGRRVTLLFGVAIFMLGSAGVALSPTFEWMLAARFIQALGAAAGLVAPRAIITDVCDVVRSARIFSILMQVMSIAPIGAPLLGGVLLLHGSWHGIFWALTVIALLCFIGCFCLVPETLPKTQRVPINVRNVVHGYLNQSRDPIFMSYSLASGSILGGLFLYISMSPYVLIQHFGVSPLHFSYFFAANAVGMILAGQINIGLLKSISEHQILAMGLILHIGFALLLVIFEHLSLASMWIYLLLLGLSIWSLSFIFGNLAAITMNYAGEQKGVASSLYGLLQYLISAIIGLVFGLMTQSSLLLPISLVGCGTLAWISGYYGRAKIHKLKR